MSSFNYQLLCMARDVRGLTQADLADKLGMGQGTLSKYETGIVSPPPEAISQMADKLEFPESFFLQAEQTYGFPPFHFRKRKKLGAKTLNRIIAEMNLRRMHVKQLTHSYERDASGFIPEIDFDEYQGISKRRSTVEDIAQHVREAWHVPPGPVANMTALIERNGGIVIPCDFGTDLIDAMSQRVDGLPVLFFVRRSAPADRVRYTLAHELGHMVLHTLSLSDDDTMEEQADAFAGAFLVPANEFKPQLRRFDLAHLANLKAYWKVSMAALAMRADRLELITPHQKKMFWIEMGKCDYRRNEPNEPPGETPGVVARMIAFHRHKLDYTDSDMAKLLHLTLGDYKRLYSDAAPAKRAPARLTVVK